MPRIPVPQSNPQLPGKIFTAETQGAGFARGLEDAGQALQQVGGALQQRQIQREISDLNAEFTKAQAELTVAWQETLRTADPSDPNTAKSFREGQVQARLTQLENLAQSGEAKRHYQRLSAGLSSSFLVSTEAGMANLAEVAAVQSFNQFQNQFADAMSADPYSFEDTLPTMDIAIEGYVEAYGLSRENALKLRTEAVENAAMAAAMGRINANPDEGIAFVSSGGYSEYLSPSQSATLQRYGDSMKKAQEAAREKAFNDMIDAKAADTLASVVNKDGTINQEALPQALAAIARDPLYRNNPSEQRSQFNLIRALEEDASDTRANKTDPALYQGLVQRALLPRGHPNRPTVQEVQGNIANGMTAADANHVIGILQGDKDPATKAFYEAQSGAFRAARSVIAGNSDLSFVDNPAAVIDYQNFENWARAESTRLFNENMSPTDVFAVDGPIYSRMPDFIRARDPQQQIGELREGLSSGRPSLQTAPGVELESDPFAPVSTTGEGTPINRMTPAEMDKWLQENN